MGRASIGLTYNAADRTLIGTATAEKGLWFLRVACDSTRDTSIFRD